MAVVTPMTVAASRNGQLTGAGLNPEQFAWLNAATLNHEVYLAMPVCDDIAQIMVGMPKSYLQLKQRAVPIPNLDPTSPFSNQARFPSFDYLYIVRGNTGKLITHTIHLMNAN